LIGDSIAFGGDANGGGNDVLDGGAGSDFVLGDSEAFVGSAIGAGNDSIAGGSASDGLIGDNVSTGPVTNAGNDVITAGDGDDRVFGDNINSARNATAGTVGGNDRVDGAGGVDTLRAGPANDHLDGGSGRPDDCDGEDGTDTFARCEMVSGSP
jgi:Ca2+-binding RTX toxin-like protein